MSTGKTLNVAELVKLLQQVKDETLEVRLKGCDCINPACGVEHIRPIKSECSCELCNSPIYILINKG